MCLFFFFNDTATTEIYTLSLHDALPILRRKPCTAGRNTFPCGTGGAAFPACTVRAVSPDTRAAANTSAPVHPRKYTDTARQTGIANGGLSRAPHRAENC